MTPEKEIELAFEGAAWYAEAFSFYAPMMQ
jgi:hypothetical protein